MAAYATEAGVTRVMPWIRAFPERVAFASLSTELGEVKMCLNAWQRGCCERTVREISANSPSPE